jgi:hypothetical protein
MRELQARGFDARQRFQMPEVNYRSANSPLARLWLLFSSISFLSFELEIHKI